MTRIYSQILNQILKYDKITIFRHNNPDGDAVFSQSGLATFLKDNFKNKKIKVCGLQKCKIFDNVEKVSTSFIKGSLAIIVDTSNHERIDDERYQLADYKIKIDHHPVVDSYGDINYVDDKKAAACQVVAEMLLSKTFSKYKISPKAAELLYSGILTDTLNFKTTSCTDKTLITASKLIKIGNIKMGEMSNKLFDKDIEMFNLVTKLRSQLIVKDHFAYALLEEKTLKKIGIDFSEAKNNIDAFGNIKGINIWAIFVYNNKEHIYEASLRSKSGYVINKIAAKFGGGGHMNASGVKGINRKQCDEIIKELIEVSNKSH